MASRVGVYGSSGRCGNYNAIKGISNHISAKKASTDDGRRMKLEFDASATSRTEPRSCSGSAVSPTRGISNALREEAAQPPRTDLSGAGKLGVDNFARGAGDSALPGDIISKPCWQSIRGAFGKMHFATEEYYGVPPTPLNLEGGNLERGSRSIPSGVVLPGDMEDRLPAR